jgi:crossover junction endodeoxyribonuclease RuvC
MKGFISEATEARLRAKPLLVMGIDPGIDRCGVAVVEQIGRAERLLHASCIATDREALDGDRLVQLYQDLKTICANFKPDEVAVEELFFAKNVTTAMRVSHARGVVLLALAEAKIAFFEYTPMEIKQTLTGSGAAKKPQVAFMAKRRLGLERIEGPDDTSDAVAIAVCHLVRRKFGVLTGGGSAGATARYNQALQRAQAMGGQR